MLLGEGKVTASQIDFAKTGMSRNGIRSELQYPRKYIDRYLKPVNTC